MLGNNKTAVWIDSKNKSSTYALSSYGSPEMLERVKIGRAFTPYQHHTLVDKFTSGSIEADILIVSDINHLYDKEDAEDIFRDMLQKVADLEDLKVLVSVSGENSLSASVFGMEENRIEVEVTGQGWKYDSEDYDQLVYRDGQSLQTTMPLWHQKSEKTKPVKTRKA
jgi:hypothetical protein